jgi:hypothetical protein
MKEVLMIRGDLYLRLDMELKESSSMQQPVKWTTQMINRQICNLSLAKRAEIQRSQNGCTLKGFPTAGHPVVILNTSCELL